MISSKFANSNLHNSYCTCKTHYTQLTKSQEKIVSKSVFNFPQGFYFCNYNNVTNTV